MDTKQPLNVASDGPDFPPLPLLVNDSSGLAPCQIPHNIDASHSAFTVVHGHQIINNYSTALGQCKVVHLSNLRN